MKQTKRILSILFFSGISLGGLYAQESLPVTGGEASGSGGTASYTVGQLSYTAEQSAAGTKSQGVQQTYEVSVISGIEDAPGISLEMAAYPNPAGDYLTIEVEKEQAKGLNLSYRLYDMSGKLIVQKQIGSRKASLSMEGFAPAVYILTVSSENKELKAFRILKK